MSVTLAFVLSATFDGASYASYVCLTCEEMSWFHVKADSCSIWEKDVSSRFFKSRKLLCSRHPLHPPTSDSWLLCPWVTVGTHHCWPHGPCISVILWLWLHGEEEKPNTGHRRIKHVMAVSDVIKPDKRKKKKHPVKHEKIMQELEVGCRERQSINHPSILTCTSLSGLWGDWNLSQLL